MPAGSRLPPGWTPLRAKLFGAVTAVVFVGMGTSGLWLVHGDLLSGRTEARHGAVLRAKEPIYFGVQMITAGTASVALLAIGVWMAWFTAFPPVSPACPPGAAGPGGLGRRRARR